MDKRSIGSLQVSVVGVGCNNFGWRTDAAGTAAVVNAALDAGVNFFDTADVYDGGHSEEFLGRAFEGRRHEAIIATKFGLKMADGLEGATPTYVVSALDASLRRLGVDYIDLYQLHRPDPATPIADTLGALDDAVRAGKVKEIGCSNFSAEQMREAEAASSGNARFVSVQNDYSLFHREPEQAVLPECTKLKVAFLPYFPLANGLLTGKYHPGAAFPDASRGKDGFGPKVFTDENLRKAQALADLASGNGRTLLELAFAWLLMKPQVASVIAGAKSAEQVKANLAAASWTLSPSALVEIERIVGPRGGEV
jgi:aryl-alcohol dehydrogenase-like predicted oxidoreductase